MKQQLCTLFIFMMSVLASAQTLFTDSMLQNWKTARADLVAFDIRNDVPVDSIAYPCFYAPSSIAEQWIDSLNCRKRLVIYCHNGVLALDLANRVIQNGYPAESIFYAGYNQLPSSRRPATDTLPLAFLGTGFTLPQNLSALQYWAVLLSKRPQTAVDVRSASEVASGIIPGVCNIAWPVPFQTSCLSFNRDADIILNCFSGTRAGYARDYMLSQGFDSAHVINFGGFSKWNAMNGPVSMIPTADCQCVGIESGTPELSSTFEISATPNPFNPLTSIALSIPGNGVSAERTVQVHIYTVNGRRVATLVESALKPGHFKFSWNASGYPSGLYLLKATVSDKTITRKLILQK